MLPRDRKRLESLLKLVSRSFYLTIRVLPARIRPQISLAYLLARSTDTISDTKPVSVERRLTVLRDARAAVANAAEGGTVQAPDLSDLSGGRFVPGVGGASAERLLLEEIAFLLETLKSLPGEDRRLIRWVLEIITRGQESDLVRFGAASVDRLEGLATDAELDEYTYFVAGCVGEFWTRMCRTHLFAGAALDEQFLLSSGVRFGKGLQLVNILRDLPEDLRQGRCYLPAARLDEIGLKPCDLLDRANMPRFRALYDGYLDKAEDHLAQGWAYTNALPYSQIRVRLACAWPVLIGIKTIELLRAGNVLDDRLRIKVNRSQVHELMLASLLRYPWPSGWRRLFDLAKR